MEGFVMEYRLMLFSLAFESLRNFRYVIILKCFNRIIPQLYWSYTVIVKVLLKLKG